MIDLASLDTGAAANSGTDVVLRHPTTGEDTDIIIRVLGRDSDTFRKIETQQQRKRLDKMAKTKKMSSVSLEEVDEDAITLLAACTVGWTNVALNGEELPFSVNNAAMIYKRFMWIREQVDMAIGDRANFMTPGRTASSSSPGTSSD